LKENSSLKFTIEDCPIGKVLIAKSNDGVCSILLGSNSDDLAEELSQSFPSEKIKKSKMKDVSKKVLRFIENPRSELDVPLDIRGTEFQKRVWGYIQDIPVGQTASYSKIAMDIGAPKSARAVAGACSSNVLAVAIPCHRVVRADGRPSGYRWGVRLKRTLLQQESGDGR